MTAPGHFFDLADFLSFSATGSTERSMCTVDLQVELSRP